MVETLQPHTYLPISRIIPDPADVTVYYPQAVIRNSRTNVIIATVNLASQGSNIYSSNWLIVSDTSGAGLFITITISIYTDSGHTTKESTRGYGDSQDTFLIYDRYNYVQNLATQIGAIVGSGHGGDIDYKKIKKIVKEVLDEEEASEDKEPSKPLDLSPILNHFSSITTPLSYISKCCDHLESLILELKNMQQKDLDQETEEVNLDPILQEIKAGVFDVKKHIDAIEFPDQEEPDLKPVMDHIDKIYNADDAKSASDSLGMISDALPEISEEVANLKTSVKEALVYVNALSSVSNKGTDSETPKRRPNSFGKFVDRNQQS